MQVTAGSSWKKKKKKKKSNMHMAYVETQMKHLQDQSVNSTATIFGKDINLLSVILSKVNVMIG